MALLLDRSRFGVALNYDETAQQGTIFAGYFLPSRLAIMFAAWNCAPFHLRREQHTPAIFRHFHIIEFPPSLWDRR